MEHIGIDLGRSHSHVMVLTEAGDVKGRHKIETPKLPRWLARQAPSRVVMEACTQSPVIARAAQEAQHDTRVVPGNIVRALGVGARGIKTDERDAEALARASLRLEELPSVHLRSENSRAMRELFAARIVLVNARKSIVLSVKSWLRGRLLNLNSRANANTFAQAVRHLALEHPDGLPLAIDVLLNSYEQLSQQIAQLNEQIEQVAQADETCRLLQTIPGVGVLTSLAFTAHVDDPERFPSSSHLASYLALVPGEATTGGKVKRTRTIKAGPNHLKALLVQCAWSMWRSRPNEPAVLWARQIAEHRGKRIAIVALARKLATIMWAMWKHRSPYDPSRAADARRYLKDEALPANNAI